MNVETNKAIIQRWIEEGWNQGNVDIADDLYASDFKADAMEMGSEDLHGIETVKGFVRELRAAFSDLHFKIEYLIAEGDIVVGSFHIKATHNGSFRGIPPTGKCIDFKAIDIWRLQHGKIIERCVAVGDFLRVLQQIGVVPRLG